ncbi:MOSC domain-containing protein YiiM [Crossiella equi]|uniref:MOSC domain-containing protein YiiM n=1 Tax=Crossiella equi TaxID=130796 RepID=A0ABS5ACU8_9PSEU|nr:MOSC domain-containing protein [Crossiella equi]MBP2474117.1 MOSC domain-containing protein YiiM [Crossiella equi]
MNVGKISYGEWTGRKGQSGIDKRPVGSAHVRKLGLDGDNICDLEVHGGEYQAVYAYALEDLAYWAAELGRELLPGNAGENLSLSGLDPQALVIGQRLRIGGTVLRVTRPRNPCQIFAGFWDVRGLVKKFTQVGRVGAYLAVEQEGVISDGDTVETLSTPGHGVTIGEVFDVIGRNQREKAPRVAEAMADLPPKVRDWVRDVLAKSEHAAPAS